MFPPGTGISKFVEVSVGGISAGGGGDIFSYDAPTVSSITPNQGPTQGGNVVTVDGSNFGNDISKVTVTIGGAQATINEIDHGQLKVVVPPGAGTNLSLSIVVDGQSAPLKLYSYLAPIVSSVSNNCLLEAGEISILGNNFGTLGATSVTINSASAPIAEQTETSIKVAVPAMVMESNTIQVSLSGQVSNSILLPKCNDKLIELENANLLFNSITSGVYFKSPNDDCWKVFVDNVGGVHAEKVDCPSSVE
jgi:hypothetical protein